MHKTRFSIWNKNKGLHEVWEVGYKEGFCEFCWDVNAKVSKYVSDIHKGKTRKRLPYGVASLNLLYESRRMPQI